MDTKPSPDIAAARAARTGRMPRFDLRIAPATLEAWHRLAEREGTTVSTLLKTGVELIDKLPPGAVAAALGRGEDARAAAAGAALVESFQAAAGGAP